MRLLPALMLSATLLTSGCASIQRHGGATPTVVAASAASPPSWMLSARSEDAEDLFFVGRAEGLQDLSRGEDQAEAQARAAIYAELHRELLRQFETGAGIGRAVPREALDRALTSSLREIDLQEAVPVMRYWERLAIPVEDGVAYAYRLALRVKMSKKDFDRCREQARANLTRQLDSTR